MMSFLSHYDLQLVSASEAAVKSWFGRVAVSYFIVLLWSYTQACIIMQKYSSDEILQNRAVLIKLSFTPGT